MPTQNCLEQINYAIACKETLSMHSYLINLKHIVELTDEKQKRKESGLWKTKVSPVLLYAKQQVVC